MSRSRKLDSRPPSTRGHAGAGSPSGAGAGSAPGLGNGAPGWLALAAAVAQLASLGCAGRAALDRHIDEVARALAEVDARGALRCAPRELAIARSHLDFARLERAQGFPSRARDHLDVAKENVQAASVLVAPDRCDEAPAAPAVSRQGLVGDVRSPRRISPHVEEVPNAEMPIWPGSTRPLPAQRGRGEPGTD